jgi:hypothetical protein
LDDSAGDFDEYAKQHGLSLVEDGHLIEEVASAFKSQFRAAQI